MKTKYIEFFRQLLITQYNHWSLFTVAFGALLFCIRISGSLCPPGMSFFYWGLLGVQPLLQYYIRRHTGKLWTMLAWHILLAVCAFFLPAEYILIRMMAVFCSLGYFINSMYRYFSETNKRDTMSALLFPICSATVVVFFLHCMGSTGYDIYYVVLLIVLTAMYFIGCYVERCLDFLRMNAESAGYIPERTIFYAGLRSVLCYTGLGVLLLVILANTVSLKRLMEWLKNGFLALLRYLFHFFSRERQSIEEMEKQVLEGGPDIIDLSGPEEPFFLWQILEKLLYVTVALALVYLLVKAVKELIGFIRRYLEGRVSRQEYTAGEFSDKREKIGLASGRKKRNAFKSFTVTERIRRQYKRRVWADQKLQESKSFNLTDCTAREYARFSGRAAVADLYEKARYSDRVCNKEDLKHMKEACK